MWLVLSIIATFASHLVTLQKRRYCNRIDMPEPDDNAHAMLAVYTVCCNFRILTVKTVCPEYPKQAIARCALTGKTTDVRENPVDGQNVSPIHCSVHRRRCHASIAHRFFRYVTIDWVCYFIGKSEVVLAFRSYFLHVTHMHVSETPTADTHCQFVQFECRLRVNDKIND